MGNYTPPSTRTRSALTLTCLWTAFIIYTVAAFVLTAFSYGTTCFNYSVMEELFAPYDDGIALTLCLLGVAAVMCSWSVALLIKGRRWAFIILTLLTLSSTVLSLVAFEKNLYTAAGFVVTFLISWLPLYFLHNGKSAWSTMDNAFDWAHCRHLNIVYFLATLVFACIGIAAVIQSPTHAKSHFSLDDYADQYGTDDDTYANDDVPADTVAAVNTASEYTANDVLEAVNNNLPVDAGNGVTVTRAEISGNYLVYIAEVDEDYMSMDDVQNSTYEIKENLRNTLASTNDPLFPALQGLNMGLAYRYIGTTSGSEAYISFSPDEVAGL